jgi:hypothetical protein
LFACSLHKNWSSLALRFFSRNSSFPEIVHALSRQYFQVCLLKEDERKKVGGFSPEIAGFSTLLTQRRCEELGFLRLLVFHIGSHRLAQRRCKRVVVFLSLCGRWWGSCKSPLKEDRNQSKICKELVSGDCAERDFQICSLKNCKMEKLKH